MVSGDQTIFTRSVQSGSDNIWHLKLGVPCTPIVDEAVLSLSESWRVWTGRMLAASPILKRHGGTIIECREDGWHAPNSQPNAALLLPGTNPASIPQVQTRREQPKAQQQQAALARRTRPSVSVERWRPLGRNRVSSCSFSSISRTAVGREEKVRHCAAAGGAFCSPNFAVERVRPSVSG